MKYPETRLTRIATQHATYPMLRVTFSDGKTVVMPQLWVASPPRGTFVR